MPRSSVTDVRITGIASDVAEIKEMLREDQRMNREAHAKFHDRINALDKDLSSSKAWIKGAWAAIGGSIAIVLAKLGIKP